MDRRLGLNILALQPIKVAKTGKRVLIVQLGLGGDLLTCRCQVDLGNVVRKIYWLKSQDTLRQIEQPYVLFRAAIFFKDFLYHLYASSRAAITALLLMLKNLLSI